MVKFNNKPSFKNNQKKQSFKNKLKNFSFENKFNKTESKIKNKEIQKEPEKKASKKPDLLKKHKIELNSKLKKKIKLTKKLLKIEDEKINHVIEYIKKQNAELSEKFQKPFYNNFYAYIILKNKLTEEIDSYETQEFKEKTKKFSKFEIEKVGDLNDPLVTETKANKIKNFFFKLPFDFSDDENNLKILLINSSQENNKSEQNTNKKRELKKKTQNQDEENYIFIEKIMEAKFKNEPTVSDKQEEQFFSNFESKIEVKNLNQFIELLKNTKQKLNLNFLYRTFICDEKLKSRINNIFSSNSSSNKSEKDSKNKFFNFFDDIIDVHFVNNLNNESKNFENISLSLDLSQKRSLVKNLNNRIFKIKFSNTSNNNEAIKKNLEYLSVNLTSFLLSKSNKYNNIKAIVIKSENSIPVTIYGNLDVDEIEYFT